MGLERERGSFGEEREEDEIRRSGDLEMVAAAVAVVVIERHLFKTIACIKDLETCG